MKRFVPHLVVALVLLSAAGLASSHGKSNEDFIQGTWRMTGQNGMYGWFLEWTFERGKFNLKGYPPLYQEGKYRIVKTEGDKLTLELYDQKGNFGTDNSRLEVVLNKKKNTLNIKGQGPFTRTEPER
jgi:hypothetical protein